MDHVLPSYYLKKDIWFTVLKRRSSSLNTERIDHIYQDPHRKIEIQITLWGFNGLIEYY